MYIRKLNIPTVFGFGYLGGTDYKAYNGGAITKEYQVWKNMLKRCYCKRTHALRPNYIGCSVSAEWLNFQNFCVWYNKQPNAHKEGFELDKDLLVDGNKTYSSETCLIIPATINNLFSGNTSKGKYLQGVTWDKYSGKFSAQATMPNGLQKKLGYFTDEFSAHQAYIIEREKHIHSLAEKFKEMMDIRLYEKLVNYKIIPERRISA